MAYVINKNLAGSELRMDDAVYVGDNKGVFEVSEEHAQFLCSTRCWSASANPPAVERVEDPRITLRAAMASVAPPPAETVSARPQGLEPVQGQGKVNIPKPHDPEPPHDPPDDSGLPMPEPPQAPAEAPQPAAESVEAPAPEEAEESAEESEEGPDLDSLDKAGLLAVAAQYEVAVPSRISKVKLREMLDKALYGEESEG